MRYRGTRSRFRGILAIVTLMTTAAGLDGCSLAGDELVQVPASAVSNEREFMHAAPVLQSIRTAEALAQLRRTISDHMPETVADVAQGEARQSPLLTRSPSLAALLNDPVVDKMLLASESAARGVPRDDIKIGLREFIAFGKVLLGAERALLEDLVYSDPKTPAEAPSSGTHSTLDAVMVAYFEAWTRGSFVTRNGEQIGRPEVDGGLDNAAITGLARVFFEALFDHAFGDMPIYYDGQEEVITVKYEPEHNSSATLPTDVQAVYQRARMQKLYITDDGQTPTGLEIGWLTERAAGENQDLTASDVRVIRFVSRFAGKRGSALSGLLSQMVSDVEISFVLGADLSFGDNDTLVALIETIANSFSVRVTERIAYQALLDRRSEGVREAEQGDPAIRLMMLGEFLNALEPDGDEVDE